MTRPPAYCPACNAITITYYRPVPGTSGDVEPAEECVRCTWDSDTVTTTCNHTTTDYCPQCGANEMEK